MQLRAVPRDALYNRAFPLGKGEMCAYSPAFAWWPIEGNPSSQRPVRVLWPLSLAEVCGAPAKFLKVRKTPFVF